MRVPDPVPGHGAKPARKMRVQQKGIDMIKVKLVRSWIGCTPRQRKVLAALGLKRPNMTNELKDTPAIRGMIAKVPHMVEVVS